MNDIIIQNSQNIKHNITSIKSELTEHISERIWICFRWSEDSMNHLDESKSPVQVNVCEKYVNELKIR